jgi:hypothetical protein
MDDTAVAWRGARLDETDAVLAEADALSLEHIERAGQVADHRVRDRVAASFPLPDGVSAEPRTGGEVFNRQASESAASAKLRAGDSN